MDWIVNNFALFSGIAVAFLSFLSTFFTFLKDRNKEAKYLKRMKDYTDILQSLPDNSKAKKNFEFLVDQNSDKLLFQTSREINPGSITATIVLALLGGVISYFLAFCANKTHGFFAVLFWVIFTLVSLFTILISIAGWTLRYKK